MREWIKTLKSKSGSGELALNQAHGLQIACSDLDKFDEARNMMVEANLRLAVWFAKRYQGRGLDMLDLIQEANSGLMVAADGFDTNSGFKFATYGIWWMRQSIQRAICDTSRTVRLPIHANDTATELQRASSKFMHEYQREPTPEELAEISGETPDVVQKILATEEMRSINAALPWDSEKTFAEYIADPGTIELDSLDRDGRRAQIEKYLKMLRPKHAEVLRLRFGFHGGPDMTWDEVANEIGLTRERVLQIKNRAFADLTYVMKGANRTMEDFG
jgi:RNA polymerase sigma factor (sigma-70 family)